ncbi:ATP synthase subunit a [Gemmatirosa kalamazoonensis]|uniref:ATP synthase subunit a n=1 Tax=Gemmatirosa kalamazoonensis TaxID=861299 RepID=W0RK59_9BACT|nr:F0F1 ATP synthase subunit A [Gemmatirosa kalamazoonensis]AHG91484.1 ATP synthase subunit a [Gemmatirosa kalamazoonensis]
MRLLGTALALLLALGAPLAAPTARAQESTTHAAPATAAGEATRPVDFITPHITDSDRLDLPCFKRGLVCEVDLAEVLGAHWYLPGTHIDVRPTKHVVMLLLAALLSAAVLILAARAHERHTHEVGRPKGFAAGIEAMVLYLRNEVAIPNLGPHGERFVPFVLTLFFFILFANLLGLIPYGSTATGNISVTATLAVITMIVIEVAGMRAQGLGYLNTIFYWNKDLNPFMRVIMFIVMTPVEMVGKLSKPFALAIRLFANMTAGHIVVLAFIGLIFAFGYLVGLAPLLMAVGIMLLEIFVAFLQAFVFCLLAAVFIGQIREAHH